MSYTYGDTNPDHAVTAMDGNTYGYDANGNQTSRTGSGSSYTLTYDQENRLVSVTGAATATFYYDGDGNRIKATVSGTTTTYIGNYFEWLTSTSNMKKYYYAGSTRVVMRTGSSTINYLMGDHLGSTSITTDSSGVRTAEKRYYPWGTERYTSGTTPTTYRFTGQRYESGLGLYFYNSRFYDPSLARFISADSIVPGAGNPQAYDRYAYVGNNPLRYIDPSGHATCEDMPWECDEDGNWLDDEEIILPPNPPPASLLEPGFQWYLITQEGITTTYYTPDASKLFNGEYDADPNNWDNNGYPYVYAKLNGSVIVDNVIWMYDNGLFRQGSPCGKYPLISLGCLGGPSDITTSEGINIKQVFGAVASCPPGGGGTKYCGNPGFIPAYKQGVPKLYVVLPDSDIDYLLVVTPLDSGGGLGATQIDVYGGLERWRGPHVHNATVWKQIPMPVYNPRQW